VTAGAIKEKESLPSWLQEALPERLDRELLERAYRFSEKAHEGQKRLSGEKFVSHCVEVAKILVDLQLDSTTVASGLIHDVVEDTAVTVDDIEAEFGKEIAEIVDGLTKIGHLPLNSSQDRQVENYRKLLLSIAKDARVILIKLADRLHNMRTLEFLPADRQKRIATETRDLYAPLAHRFGMARVRWELEDLAFKHLEPSEYKMLAKKVATRRVEREKSIAQLREPLEAQLKKAGIANVEVTGRPKHLWSIQKKMKKWDKPYEEIYDLLAVRVTVNGATVYLHDVAHVRDGYAVQQNIVRQDGQRGVLLSIQKAGNASTLAIVSAVRAALPKIAATLPPQLVMHTLLDQSIFVRASLVTDQGGWDGDCLAEDCELGVRLSSAGHQVAGG